MTKDPTPDDMALVTVSGEGMTSLEAAAAQLGVAPEDIDPNFGIVPIDPRQNLFAVQVRADRLPEGFGSETPYRGPFSSPRIAPFGLEDEPPSKKRP